MTQDSNPCDNTLVERVNGIIKNEFKREEVYKSHNIASRSIEKNIDIYNKKRLHGSLDYLTPEVAHNCHGALKKRWKSYRKKKIYFDDQKDKEQPQIYSGKTGVNIFSRLSEIGVNRKQD